MKSFRRHLLPICCTTGFILAAWVILTMPMVAVFLLDREFVISDYAKFVLYAAGVAAGVSGLVMFPLSLLFERLVGRARVLAIVIPIALVLIALASLVARFLLTGQFFDTIFGWPGLLLGFSVVFGFYWGVLWIGKGLVHGVQKLRAQALPPAPPPVNS